MIDFCPLFQKPEDFVVKEATRKCKTSMVIYFYLSMNGPQRTAVSRKELLGKKQKQTEFLKETDIGGEELPGGNKINHAWCSIDIHNRLLYEPPPPPQKKRMGARNEKFWPGVTTRAHLETIHRWTAL